MNASDHLQAKLDRLERENVRLVPSLIRMLAVQNPDRATQILKTIERGIAMSRLA